MPSSWSATSRTASMAGSTLSRMYAACFMAVPCGWLAFTLSSVLMRVTSSRVSSVTSAVSSSMPASSHSSMWRRAAGRMSVRAMLAAVSASMFSLVMYCSTNTSYRACSSRLPSTWYLANTCTVLAATNCGRASGVVRRFSRPRFSASLCQASE